jgi:exodeoxyribonuclease V alpha subunit
MSARLVQLRAQAVLSPLDEQLARTLCRLGNEHDERVLLAVALLSREVSNGHVCLPLPALVSGELTLGDGGEALTSDWPEPDAWLAALRQSPLCGERSGESTPLVLDPYGRLYLRRHFERERTLAAEIQQRVGQTLHANGERIAQRLKHYFGTDPDDLQRQAAELALTRAFCVISGGPGTGKTSTVVKILALIIEESQVEGGPALRIALVAPTGKAAVRLETAVRSAKLELACDERVRDGIPDTATTIHRALRTRARGRAVQPAQLSVDLLLIDEASMVDLELMTELLCAIPPHARVILLGDRHQLASVEAGAVLGDICGVDVERSTAGPERAPSQSELAKSIISLTRSYRYAADSGIGELARAIQASDPERALAILADPAYPDVALHEPAARGLSDELAAAIVSGYRPYLEVSANPAQALRRFDEFRVLCAHRRGEQGVEAMNRAIARLLFERGLIDRSEGNFIGRTLLVTENDYRNRLWNGDVGLVTRGAHGLPVACFVAPDGLIRELGFGRLPPHESAFAISVHKSQGSEVAELALILPTEPSRVLTRELLYTAVTRARRRVVIHGSRKVVAWAITHRVARSTGLRELLY